MNRRASDYYLQSQNSNMLQDVGEIKGTLDRFIATQDEHNKKIETKLDGFDARLRSVETKSAIAGAIVGAIIAVLVFVVQEQGVNDWDRDCGYGLPFVKLLYIRGRKFRQRLSDTQEITMSRYEARKIARCLYINEGYTISAISSRLRVSDSALRRWRAEDAVNGDDWDRARTAAKMSKENIETATQEYLELFLMFHR